MSDEPEPIKQKEEEEEREKLRKWFETLQDCV